MRTSLSRLLFIALAGLLGSTTTFAHHGAPGYDFSKALNLEGRIVEIQWKNPHVYFTIDTGTKGADSRPRILEIECASPGQLVAFGTPRAMLKPGTHVKVLAFARLKDPDGANYKGATVTPPSGSVYFLENSNRRTLVQETIAAQALAGKWVPASVSNFGEYTTAEAKARGTRGADAEVATKAQAAIDAAGNAGATSCAKLAADSVPFLTAAGGGLRTIEISDKSVAMRIENSNDVLKRVIDLTQTAHPAKITPTPNGRSIGHWEGKTLVIDTVGFTPTPTFPAQGAHKHLVERLTLTDDRRHIQYEFTVEDPDYYPVPFHFSMQWTYRPDLEFSGAACDDKVARKYLAVK
jgi:hypothetical protein